MTKECSSSLSCAKKCVVKDAHCIVFQFRSDIPDATESPSYPCYVSLVVHTHCPPWEVAISGRINVDWTLVPKPSHGLLNTTTTWPPNHQSLVLLVFKRRLRDTQNKLATMTLSRHSSPRACIPIPIWGWVIIIKSNINIMVARCNHVELSKVKPFVPTD